MIAVAESAVMVPALVPNITDVAPLSFLPLMVTFVFPARGPEAGLSDVTTGADGLAATVSTAALALTVVEPITERENV